MLKTAKPSERVAILNNTQHMDNEQILKFSKA